MPTSPSSSAQQAREALAARLHDLRRAAGLSGQELAERCGWYKSKTSRIENARTLPTDADIRAWCWACNADEESEDLLAAARHAETLYVQWRRLHRCGLRQVHEASLPLYESTCLFRVYCSTVMPGLLQTPGYATDLLAAITAFQGTPDDVPAAVAARTARSRVVHDSGRRFMLLVEEAVLRCGVGNPAAMVDQLGHLLEVMALPNVCLGVVPFGDRSQRIWPLETFMIFNDARVHVELLTARVTITAPSEVAAYERAFIGLSELALYGADACARIRAALGTLG
ncbi:helix-turn-helix domain-containing protein [Streptomyces chrestomyceticus]|uniref:helix-turn-helix domain-containing protein n=1 Tax=Streptomyces chrestomyceticus TaxID=68185 RepID=UPI0033E8F75D